MKWLLLLLLLVSCTATKKDIAKTHPLNGVYRNRSTDGNSTLWHYLVDSSHLRIPETGTVTLTVIDKKHLALSCHSNDTLLAVDTIKCRRSGNGLRLSRYSHTTWDVGPLLWHNQTNRRGMTLTDKQQLLAYERSSGIMMALFMPLMAVAPYYTDLYDRVEIPAEQPR